MRKILYDILPIFIITVIIGIYFKNLFVPTLQFISTPDFGTTDAHTGLSLKFLLSEALSQHRLPLWTESWGGGVPVGAVGGIGTFYILNLLLFGLLPFAWAFNLTVVTTVLVIAVGMYYWSRSLGMSRLTGLYTAITFGLSGVVITQLTHLPVAQSMSLLPLAACLATQLLRKPKLPITLALAFILSQQWLIGFAQSIVITHAFILAYSLLFIRNTKNPPKATLGIFAAMAIGVLGGAAQWLPAVEYLGEIATPTGFSQNVSTMFSYPIKHLFTIMSPFALGNPKFGTYPPFTEFSGSIFWENTAYMGIAPIALLICGLLAIFLRQNKNNKLDRWQKPLIFFLGASLTSLLLMLGSHSPIYLLFSFWPLTLFRVPSRFIWIFAIGLIMSSGVILDRIGKKLPPQYSRITIMIIIIANTIILWTTFNTYHMLEPVSLVLRPPSTRAIIPNGALIYTIGNQIIHNQLFAKGWSNQTLYPALSANLPADKAPMWHLRNFDDVTGRQLRRTGYINQLLAGTINVSGNIATVSASGAKILSLAGVSHLVAAIHTNIDDWQLTDQIVTPVTNVQIFANPKATPAVYLAGRLHRANTLEEAASQIIKADFVVGTDVLVSGELLAGYQKPTATPSRVKFDNDDTTLRIDNLRSPALLVHNRLAYPGWVATIDGLSTPIIAVNINKQGIIVPAGSHTIKFAYKPASVRIGIGISAITYFISTFILLGSLGFFYAPGKHP